MLVRTLRGEPAAPRRRRRAFPFAATAGGTASVGPVAGIGTADAFGVDVVGASAGVAPGGIASGETFGVDSLGASAGVSPGGIPSAETFGSDVVDTSGAGSISPPGIPTAESFGTDTVGASAGVAPGGVGSAEAFGTPGVSGGAPPVVAAFAVDFGSTLFGWAGSPAIGAAPASSAAISPAGILSAESFGTPGVAGGSSPPPPPPGTYPSTIGGVDDWAVDDIDVDGDPQAVPPPPPPPPPVGLFVASDLGVICKSAAAAIAAAFVLHDGSAVAAGAVNVGLDRQDFPATTVPQVLVVPGRQSPVRAQVQGGGRHTPLREGDFTVIFIHRYARDRAGTANFLVSDPDRGLYGWALAALDDILTSEFLFDAAGNQITTEPAELAPGAGSPRPYGKGFEFYGTEWTWSVKWEQSLPVRAGD